ncbi:hypothetical protein ABH15_13090 [Methanoculleus taiwanensis]|uniref:Protein kinase domain-containing protein n=1 Tax=Methanoculleus taiwanensis TaxID=1550565 RepID=A0A498GZE1_9EURY|nr:hypothetical protein ABH15_13090 [Methanoculleus taiwanensis]
MTRSGGNPARTQACRCVLALLLLLALLAAPCTADAPGTDAESLRTADDDTVQVEESATPAKGNSKLKDTPGSNGAGNGKGVTPDSPASRQSETPTPGSPTVQPAGGTVSVFAAEQNRGTPERGSAVDAPLLLLAGIALLAALAVFVWYSRQEQNRELPETGTAATILAEPGVPETPAGLQNRYSRMESVGRGGLGRVFRAERKSDGAIVAVKIPIAFDEATGRSFLKEMRFWEELTHPNIVEVYSVNILPVPYVEMEYVAGTLEALRKPISPEACRSIAMGIAEGLSYAHGRGVIHRDIKPHNILIGDDGAAKITDWGMGTALAGSRATSSPGFSLVYAAPEQIAPGRFGRTDERTDIYQLGVVLYELLTGTVPFPGEDIAAFSTALLETEPVPPSVIRPGIEPFDPIIRRCLAKNPDHRYQTAADLAADLAALPLGEQGEERA